MNENEQLSEAAVVMKDAYDRLSETTKAMTAAQEVFWEALADFDGITQVGWWNRNTLRGRVHPHTERHEGNAYHRSCVPVFVR